MIDRWGFLGGSGSTYAGAVTSSSPERFDAGFYRRFYLDPRTRVVTRAEMARRAEFVAAFARHGEQPVRRSSTWVAGSA